MAASAAERYWIFMMDVFLPFLTIIGNRSHKFNGFVIMLHNIVDFRNFLNL